MLLAATFAFFQLTGADKVNSKAASPFFVDKKESWIVRDKFYSDSECSAEHVTKSDYYKISSDCEYQYTGCDSLDYVDFKGWRYFTLANTDPYSTTFSCNDEGSYELSRGWELAPDNDDVRTVASDYPWSSQGLFLANGKFVVTRDMIRDGRSDNEDIIGSRDNGETWYKSDVCEFWDFREGSCDNVPMLFIDTDDEGRTGYGVSSCEYYKANILARVRVPGHVKMSCHSDPTTNGIYVTRTNYGEDEHCFGDASNAIWQESIFLDSLPTLCNDGTGDLWGENDNFMSRKLSGVYGGYKGTFTGYPHIGSEVFRCENLDSRQLPFDASAANTLVDIGYINDNCNMDAENVKVATVLHINQCVAFDITDGYGIRLDDDQDYDDDDDDERQYAEAKSMKVSGCGYDVDFYTDDRCMDRDVRLSTSFRNSNDFECKTDTDDDDDTFRIKY